MGNDTHLQIHLGFRLSNETGTKLNKTEAPNIIQAKSSHIVLF